MIDVLSEEGRQVIRAIARERSLLAFDFDGTLAPIVDHPGDARVGDHTRALLRAAALLFPCAIISGRARADLAVRLARMPMAALFGNHGAEAGALPPSPAIRAQVRGWVAALSEAAGEPGIEVEDKGFTVAVHYRRAREPAEARRRILQRVSSLPGARVFGGHDVVNLAPAGAPTKAGAVEAFAARFPPGPLLFAGDDDTDEDAFRSPVVTCAVRVGRGKRTAARYYLEDQARIDVLLWALISERARVSGQGDALQELQAARKLGGIE